MIILIGRNCPFDVVLRLNEKGDPVFICVFYLLWLHKKYILRRKIWIAEVVFFFFFLLMNGSNFRIQSHREVRDNVKTVHFSTFFQDWVIWGYLTEKIRPRKKTNGP